MKKIKVSKQRKQLKSTTRQCLIIAAPSLIAQFIFGWLPFCAAFIVGFQKFYLFKPCVFVGLNNFKSFFYHNPMTLIIFRNTFYYAFLSIALTFIIPIIIAILLMEMKKSVIRVMMLLWFIPVASMAGIIIWKYFYNVNYGLFNGILASLGLPLLRWLNDPHLAMLCLVLPGLVMYGPGLIYIASLQSIPEELYEAAELEGAKFWQKVWHITLPRLRPIIAMMMLLAIIGKLQIFNEPYVMTGGGPSYATYTVVMHIFSTAFQSMQFGKATALSLILFVIIMILIIIQRRYFKENIDV